MFDVQQTPSVAVMGRRLLRVNGDVVVMEDDGRFRHFMPQIVDAMYQLAHLNDEPPARLPEAVHEYAAKARDLRPDFTMVSPEFNEAFDGLLGCIAREGERP